VIESDNVTIAAKHTGGSGPPAVPANRSTDGGSGSVTLGSNPNAPGDKLGFVRFHRKHTQMGDILSFDEHRRSRDDDDDTVRCARCGKTILATSLRCPECGVHFQGEAQDFIHPTERRAHTKPNWVIVAAIVLLIVFVISALAP
jgi:hypothetical protein